MPLRPAEQQQTKDRSANIERTNPLFPQRNRGFFAQLVLKKPDGTSERTAKEPEMDGFFETSLRSFTAYSNSHPHNINMTSENRECFKLKRRSM